MTQRIFRCGPNANKKLLISAMDIRGGFTHSQSFRTSSNGGVHAHIVRTASGKPSLILKEILTGKSVYLRCEMARLKMFV